ncbi:hypothetical protein VM1G_09341 [Cytospora mali]|uniref:DUF7918 domain-containing protein n=1 Tax=Cytospora mali TaxID=578113 RepID=A0A194WCG4_CYTMA|nr:hypothetical protein VM1G_09341 [Valsa mali]
MAIIEELGIEAKILVDGSAATEYTPDEEPEIEGDNFGPSTRVCCRYVEAIDNAHFALHAGIASVNSPGNKWLEESWENGFSFGISIDGGKTVSSQIVQQYQYDTLQGVIDGQTGTIRKFRFASVSTVDDASKNRVAKDLKAAKNLGLIRLVIRRVVVTSITRNSASPIDTSNLANGEISLAEKALKGKAISHGTTLSAPVRYNALFVSTSPVDPKDSPFAVFYFKYRSKEALQQELIIPRPRSLSMESDVDNLSPEELRRLARERLSQMRGNKRSGVKADSEEASGSSRPYKLVKIEGDKRAIDLTEDD